MLAALMFAGTPRRGAAPPRRTHRRPRRHCSTSRIRSSAASAIRCARRRPRTRETRLARRHCRLHAADSRGRRRHLRSGRPAAPRTRWPWRASGWPASAGRGHRDSKRKVYKKGWLMSDSMSLSKVCWISTVLPGYGQIYNKQYWKLPILYGTGGSRAGDSTSTKTGPTSRSSASIDAYTDENLTRTPELDALQAKMIRSNTRRQVYLGTHRSPRTSTSSATRP